MATTITTGQTASTLPQKKGDPPNFGTVKSGRALAFDGVVDTFTLPTTGNLEEFTTAQWVYITAHSSDGYNNLFAGNNAGSYMSVSAENKLEWYSNDSDAGNSGWIESPVIFTLNAWHRIVFTFKKNGSGGDYNAYMDGSQAGGDFPVTTDSGYTNGSMSRFASFGGTGRFITGRASDLQIWDKQWTLTDVQNDYRHPEMLAHTFSGTSLTESNLLRWYPLTEGNPESPQTTIFDGSGNKNHATSVFLGDELITVAVDKTLDAGNNWNVSAIPWQAVGGNLRFSGFGTAATSLDEAYPAFVAGKTYEIRFGNANTDNDTTITWKDGDGSNTLISEATYSNGTKTPTFVAPATTTGLTIAPATASGGFDIEWINVKEIGLSTTGHVEGQETIFQPAFVGQNRMVAFDGVDDIVTVSDHNDFTFGDGNVTDSAFSLSAWICMDEATNYSIITKGTTEWSVHTGTNDKLYFLIHDNSASHYEGVGSSATLSANKWYHIVATYNGVGGTDATAGCTLYVDGSSVGTDIAQAGTYAAMHNTSEDVIFGKRSSDYANGITTEACIWNKELSLAEVQELYNDGVALDATTHSAVSNLKGYWRNNSLTTAGLWEDLSTNDNHGTLSGGSTVIFPEGTTSGRDINGFFLTHPNKNWLSLDKSDDSGIVIPHSEALDFGTGDFTLECWAKCTNWDRDDADNDTYLISSYKDDNNRWYLDTNDAKYLQFYSVVGGTPAISSLDSTALTNNTWYHIVYSVVRSGNAKMYLNGVLADDEDESSFSSVNYNFVAPVHIGYYISGRTFDGFIDDVRIYKRALSASEVTKNYRHGSGKHKD